MPPTGVAKCAVVSRAYHRSTDPEYGGRGLFDIVERLIQSRATRSAGHRVFAHSIARRTF